MSGPAMLSFCGQEVRRHDGDRFLCALFAPAAAREDLFAIYALALEIARVREEVSQPMLGAIRLQWWREGIASIYASAPREHPVLNALAGAIERHRVEQTELDDLIDARSRDLDDAPMADLRDLENYVSATSGAVTRVALGILGMADEVARETARHVGIGFGLSGVLRAVPFQARSRRVMLPANVMAAEGLDPEDVLRGRCGDGLRRTVATVAELARAHLAAGRRVGAGLPRPALAALLIARLADNDLDRLAAVGHDPFKPALAVPGFGRKLRVTFSALRGRF